MSLILKRGWGLSVLIGVLAVAGCTESNEGFRTFNAADEVIPTAPSTDSPAAVDSSAQAIAQTHSGTASAVPASPAEAAATHLPATEKTAAPAAESPAASSFPSTVSRTNPLTPPAPPAAESIQQVSASRPIRKIELLVPEKTFKIVGPEDAIRVSFDDLDLLKVLNADPVPLNIVDYMPQWLKALTGTRVRIRGFMYPTNSETELRGFMMVRDSKDCCFGRNVLIYDKIGVRMRDGVTTDYIQLRPFDVVGIMRVKARIEDGQLLFLYIIDDAVVIEG